MASDALITAPDPTGELTHYLSTLNGALPPGPRRVRREILDEIADGLLTAADRQRQRGATPTVALRAALAEMGPPQTIAAAFAAELAIGRARRLLAALLLTGPAVGVWWLLLLAPRPWSLTPVQLVAAIPVLPVVAVGVVVVVAFLWATGRHAPRLPPLSPRAAARLVQVSALSCLAVDVTMLARLVVLAAAPAPHSMAIMAVAAVASLTRLLCLVVAVGRPHRSAPIPV